jgi:transcriptional regulator with XRE-family HTH domain
LRGVALRGPNPLTAFGLAVRRRREALGISQEELAEKAGIHRNYCGEVERGKRNVALLNMAKIARALGVPLSQLVQGID